jgi:hypothetical protein
MYRARTLLAGLLGVAAPAAAMPARAEILVTMSRPNNNFSGFGAGGQLVPLTPNGTTQTPAFNVPAGGRFIVSYSAECANDAAGYESWVTLETRAVNADTGAIIVLPPTNSSRPGRLLYLQRHGWARRLEHEYRHRHRRPASGR